MTPGTLVRIRPDYVGDHDEPFTMLAEEGRIGAVRDLREDGTVFVKFNAEGAPPIGRSFAVSDLETV